VAESKEGTRWVAQWVMVHSRAPDVRPIGGPRCHRGADQNSAQKVTALEDPVSRSSRFQRLGEEAVERAVVFEAVN